MTRVAAGSLVGCAIASVRRGTLSSYASFLLVRCNGQALVTERPSHRPFRLGDGESIATPQTFHRQQPFYALTAFVVFCLFFYTDNPETTDTGSAFSYLESNSIGQSVVPEGGIGALEAFTGPVYSLVAALLEQDMARAPRDKRGHRFLELFYLSNGNSFQVTLCMIQQYFIVCTVSGRFFSRISPCIPRI